MSSKCGHTARGNGLTFTCDKPKGHKGLHAQRTKLRDYTSVTTWGSDGLAPWATKDPARYD
jgi:hypothetical protein